MTEGTATPCYEFQLSFLSFIAPSSTMISAVSRAAFFPD